MNENSPGGHRFPRGFFKIENITVGEQITAEQLIEKAQSYDDT